MNELAATQGFEPQSADSESAVLPLDDVAIILFGERARYYRLMTSHRRGSETFPMASPADSESFRASTYGRAPQPERANSQQLR